MRWQQDVTFSRCSIWFLNITTFGTATSVGAGRSDNGSMPVKVRDTIHAQQTSWWWFALALALVLVMVLVLVVVL